MSEDQAKFEGWARVEVMGHQTHIGHVRTEAYGQAVLFRIDTPPLEEREYALESPEYARVNGELSERWCPVGTVVKRCAVPGISVLVGAGSIYRIVPLSEAAALKAIETQARAPLMAVQIPEQKQLAVTWPEGERQADDEEDEDDDAQ